MKPSNKPTHFVQFGETDLYKPTRSNKSGLSQQIKDIVDEAYNANLDSEKITKAPVGASGVTSSSSRNYKDIIAWALKEIGFEDPYWKHERKILDIIIKLAEQVGYERGKRETK